MAGKKNKKTNLFAVLLSLLGISLFALVTYAAVTSFTQPLNQTTQAARRCFSRNEHPIRCVREGTCPKLVVPFLCDNVIQPSRPVVPIISNAPCNQHIICLDGASPAPDSTGKCSCPPRGLQTQ